MPCWHPCMELVCWCAGVYHQLKSSIVCMQPTDFLLMRFAVVRIPRKHGYCLKWPRRAVSTWHDARCFMRQTSSKCKECSGSTRAATAPVCAEWMPSDHGSDLGPYGLFSIPLSDQFASRTTRSGEMLERCAAISNVTVRIEERTPPANRRGVCLFYPYSAARVRVSCLQLIPLQKWSPMTAPVPIPSWTKRRF